MGIVGSPIAQVRAPEVWTGLFHFHGLNIICVPFHMLPEGLPDFFAGARRLRNLAGLIVTIPHKPAAVNLVDGLTERAALVRSVNFICIRPDGRWVGDIVDGIGFVENLKAHGVDPRGMRALLIGTGGVGTAIAFALAESGVSELFVHDRDTARSDGLAARLSNLERPVRTGPPDPAGFDLVVNASPLGMKSDDPMPMDATRIGAGSVVADVIVHETELLRRAAALGCRTIDGTGMMDHQLAFMAGHMGLGEMDFSAATARRIAAAARR
ncbi:shikimate dehydrogenase family protein [Mesorhizobium sp. L-8-3]|uniref:shikimate dehydrogenase family protein n=1 Tax=Mesorhizobium sp. L-8-3 TaxID=2744522 RepID=UPI0019263F56|nr:shikimate dehydrogenase [Mesorhizobium sp. L-8-3]